MFKIYQIYLTKKFCLIFLKISAIFFSLSIILGILEEISFFKDLNEKFFYPYFLTLLNAPTTLFEIFPFVIVLTTKFFFYDLYKKNELNLLKKNGLSNLKIIKLIFIVSVIIGLLNVTIYYNLSSKLQFHYTSIKNNLSKDNKYLAMVTESGLWIKDEIENKKMIIKSKKINGNILSNTIINEFNQNFELIRTIQSEKIDIKNKLWIIDNPIVSTNNIEKKVNYKIRLLTNFDVKVINSLFSNITTLNLIKLFDLKKDYKNLGYSTVEIILHLLKLFTMPFFFGILTILSSIILFYFTKNKPLLFILIFGIIISIIIYYMNFIFYSLGVSGKIPILLSIFFPLLISSIISLIGIINLNAK